MAPTVSTSYRADDHPLEGIVPDIERAILDPIIADINRLKIERNAVLPRTNAHASLKLFATTSKQNR